MNSRGSQPLPSPSALFWRPRAQSSLGHHPMLTNDDFRALVAARPAAAAAAAAAASTVAATAAATAAAAAVPPPPTVAASHRPGRAHPYPPVRRYPADFAVQESAARVLRAALEEQPPSLRESRCFRTVAAARRSAVFACVCETTKRIDVLRRALRAVPGLAAYLREDLPGGGGVGVAEEAGGQRGEGGPRGELSTPPRWRGVGGAGERAARLACHFARLRDAARHARRQSLARLA